MLVYLIVLLILIYPYIWKGSVRDNSRQRKLLCFLVLFLVAALNYNLGSDTRGLSLGGFGYVYHYQRIPDLLHITSNDFSEETWQPGFVYLFSFFKTISPNYLVYQIFHAFVINLIIIFFLKKNTVYLGVSLFFYCMLNYFDFNFEIQRESFTIVIGLLLYLYLEKSNGWYKYILAIVFAVLSVLLIHKSAFILILFPLLINVEINRRRIIICFVLTLAIQVLWSRLTEISFLIDFVAGDTYSGYLRQEISDKITIGPMYYLRLALVNVVIPYLFIILSFKLHKTRYLQFAMLSIAFECLTDFTFAFHRMYGYFAPFYWLVLTDGVVYLGKKVRLLNISVIRAAFVIGMALYLVYTYHMIYFHEDPATTNGYIYEWYFPYESVLEPGKSYLNY